MLKGYANFKGFVVSDWGATHSVSPAINAGLDIDMPDGHYYNQQSITAALAVKNITTDQLHDSCVRIMSGWYNIPEDRRSPCGNFNIILVISHALLSSAYPHTCRGTCPT